MSGEDQSIAGYRESGERDDGACEDPVDDSTAHVRAKQRPTGGLAMLLVEG